MEIIPAIDVREGQCSRILGADRSTESIRSEDVVEQAAILAGLGARWLHITDLDGAFSGHLCNLRLVQEIKEHSGLRIEHSGGCRTMEHIETLISVGVERVVLSTSVLRNTELTRRALDKYGDKILPGVNGRDGMVALEGFDNAAATSVIKLLNDLKAIGVENALYTDRRRVGAMRGPNFEGVGEIMAIGGLKISVAGGINSYDAIQHLKDMGATNLIIGKAIYTGAIDLRRAEEIARA